MKILIIVGIFLFIACPIILILYVICRASAIREKGLLERREEEHGAVFYE
jgi:hypothetical protein